MNMDSSGRPEFEGKGGQRELLDAGEVLVASGEALAKKRFTGESVSEDERRVIIEMKAAGHSRSKIAAHFQVLGRPISRNTVAAVVADAVASGELPEFEKRMVAKLEIVTEDWMDARLEKGAEKLSALDFGILMTKRQELRGMPTVVVGVVNADADHEKYRRLIAEALRPAALPAPEGGQS